MDRRSLLGAGLAGAGWLAVGHSALATVGPVVGAAPSRRLVVVFLRGAVDGLSVVVPYADADYYRARSTIAIAPPGREDGGFDLDGYFALHPALAPLLPHWQSGRLGFVHAAGSPDPTRSHFDAQDYMESGTPGRKATVDGWLNRLAGVLSSVGGGPAGSLSIGPVLPRILAGAQPVAILPSGQAATRPTPLDRPRVARAFDQLYAGDDPMSQAYREAQTARREMQATLARESDDAEMLAAGNGAASPDTFSEDAGRLARLLRGDDRIRLAFMAVGGWDTHANQGAGRGQLANRLAPLGRGLNSLATGLGRVLDDTVIVVLSEFGRTVRQNGNGGTDHGHGNVMWLLGGPVAGGKVHGRWPGLAEAALYEGRDLAVTSDFRSVLAQVAAQHLRLSPAQLAGVFPQFDAGHSGLALLRS